VIQIKGFGDLWLRRAKKGRKLNQIDVVLPIVVGRVAGEPTDTTVGCWRLSHESRSARGPGRAIRAGERPADQSFEPGFTGIGRVHGLTSSKSAPVPASEATMTSV